MSRTSFRAPIHGGALPSRERRAPAPETTGAEASYLAQAIDAKATIVIRLLGGGEARGTLLAHDREMLEMSLEGGEPPVLLRKSGIKYLWAEGGTRRGRA